MSYLLCEKVRSLTPYQPITGSEPIRLDANESFFDLNRADFFPPQMQPLREKALSQVQEALSQTALNRYPDPDCTQAAQAFAQRFGVDPAQVTAGNGSDELISLLCGCLLEAGGRLVTAEPDFSMYRFYGSLYGLKPLSWQKPPDLTIDPAALVDFCRAAQANALIFSNPCNPTSLTLSRDGVRFIVESLPQTLVVVDEAYMEFSVPESVLDLVGQYDNLIVLKTCSKALGLAGIRLGFAVAGPTLTQALRAAKSPYNVNALSQAVGSVVLQNGALCDYCAGALISSRVSLQRQLEALLCGRRQVDAIYPSQTNFVFLKTPAAEEWYAALRRRGIVIRQMGGYLRITAGSETENQALLQALEQVVQ